MRALQDFDEKPWPLHDDCCLAFAEIEDKEGIEHSLRETIMGHTASWTTCTRRVCQSQPLVGLFSRLAQFLFAGIFLHQCVYIRFTHIMNMQPRLYVGSAMHHANCPDHLALGDVATLLTILQTAPINQHHQARFIGEWYMLLDFLRPHMSVGDNVKFSRSIQENPTVSPGDLVKGCRFRRLNVTRKIVIKDVPSLLTVALDICKLLRWDNAAYAKDVAVPWEALYLQPCVSWLCPLVTVNRFGPSISKRL